MNFFERDGLETYDCSPVIDANGLVLGMTRMVHITEYPCFHEQGYYTPGDTGAPVYDTKAGRIGVAICYDRHFPEYMRALAVAAPIWSWCRRPDRSGSGPMASTRPRCASPPSRTAITWRSATASARKTASTSPASRSSAVPTAE